MLILLPSCYVICLTRHRYSARRSIFFPLLLFFPTAQSFAGFCCRRHTQWLFALWLSGFSLLCVSRFQIQADGPLCSKSLVGGDLDTMATASTALILRNNEVYQEELPDNKTKSLQKKGQQLNRIQELKS